MISKPGHFQILFDSQKPEEAMEKTYLHLYCSAPLYSGLGQISMAHCAKPQGQERKERVVALLSFLRTLHREQPRAHSWKQSGC